MFYFPATSFSAIWEHMYPHTRLRTMHRTNLWDFLFPDILCFEEKRRHVPNRKNDSPKSIYENCGMTERIRRMEYRLED